MATIAYLFPAFPVFHQTFVLWEVLGLRRNGLDPKIYSLRRPSAHQQPEGRAIVGDVVYLPGVLSMAVLRSNLRMLRAEPRRFLWLYRELFEAWRAKAVEPARDEGWAREPVSLSSRLRGWLNTQPTLYLLKSLALVPVAVYLAERLASDGATHLHAHWASYPATVAYVVNLISGLPFSISAHAYDIYMVPRMLPAKVRAARFVVTCARTNATFLAQLAGAELAGKIVVNYHGVDIGRFTGNGRVAKRPGQLMIVSCGQLERYKGMHHLIDACADLDRREIRLDCWIVGEGPQRSQLQRQILRLGLTERVHLTGAQSQAELVELLCKADVFVLASELAGKSGRRDVIANVLVEAMASGLPVVASRIPGVEELVDDGSNGYLTEPNRVDQLAEAIAKLAMNPEARVRLGQAAREKVVRDFDNSKNVRVLVELLRTSGEARADT